MRVGTRSTRIVSVSKAWDHPHACGDKYLFRVLAIAHRGSSPCVWGQDLLPQILYKGGRIIPMRVGTRSREQVQHELC